MIEPAHTQARLALHLRRQKQAERLNKIGSRAEREGSSASEPKEGEKDAGKKKASLVKKKADAENEMSEQALHELQVRESRGLPLRAANGLTN